MRTPTEHSLQRLRALGYVAEVVEHRHPVTRELHDLWGFVDIVALRDDETLAVQCTSESHAASRVRKIAEHPNVGAVRKAGWRIEVWGWRKVRPDGKPAKTGEYGRWQCKVRDVS